MSSATSIDGPQEVDRVDGRGAAAPAGAAAEGFRPVHFFILASLIAATAAVVMSRDPSPAHLILISLTIAAAGLAAAGVYRTLSPLVAPDLEAFREPLSARARAATEREKALVLRSLKELEFDKAMGKLSERDFDEMASRLRARAVALMKRLQEEEGGYRTMVERDLAARLAARLRASSPAAPAVGAAKACAACESRNDADAAFCKRCGASLA